MTEAHGYVPYTKGCRCDTCRAAKAEYMRQRRANAREIARQHTAGPTGAPGNRHNAFAPGATRYIAKDVKHGGRAAYDEHGCRCRECTDAHHHSHRARYGLPYASATTPSPETSHV